MNWDLTDFVVFFGLIAIVGGVYWLASRKSASTAYRFGAGTALAAAFILLWVNGAVGIIGDEGNAANLLFFGVLAVGVVGALIARFKPQGMARALLATAVAQALVGIVAIVGGMGTAGPVWPRDVLFLTLFFAALWLISAWLFRNAARQSYVGESKV